jgi:hypothetical protein
MQFAQTEYTVYSLPDTKIGKVLRVIRIKPHAPPLVQASVNSFEFNLAATFPRRYFTR